MKKSRHISTSRFIFFGFLGVIVLGTFILMLPISSSSGEFTSVVDALFTATSATCVTGLVVHDTATYWSAFGQGVIIVLIQIGGMGVITIALLLTRMSGRKIGLRQRTLMQEAISAHKMGGIVKLTGFIVKMMLIFELAGAVLMYPEFAKQFGIIKGIWYSLFHSISAFCNAGFDLMGVREHYSSLTTFSSSVLINVVIMLLIIIGGIGFVTSVPVAFLMAWYRPVRYIVEPWIQFIRNIPPLAYVPLVVISAGVGRRPQVIVIWLATFLIMTVTIYQGVRNVDETLIKAAKVLGAKDSDLFVKVIFPATTPFIITAVRLGVSVALTTLIAAESTGAIAGMGMRIRSLNNTFEVEPMLLYIIMIGIIGITSEKIIKYLERRFTGWQETRNV